MELNSIDPLMAARRSPADMAYILIGLFAERFGGASGGRYRVSRKFLRQLAGRRRLTDGYLAALAAEMFEAGFVFVDCESYSIVLSQKQFASYRRVTAAAVTRILSHEEASDEAKAAVGEESDRRISQETEKRRVQEDPKIH